MVEQHVSCDNKCTWGYTVLSPTALFCQWWFCFLLHVGQVSQRRRATLVAQPELLRDMRIYGLATMSLGGGEGMGEGS